MTPTQRTLELYRGQGFVVEVVERWIQGANIRRDLFGFADLLAFSPESTVAIQCTSTPHLPERVEKAREMDTLAKWLQHPSREAHFVGWRRYAKPLGGKWWRPTVIVRKGCS